MQEALQRCLEELEQGRSLEQCLALYPEEAGQLEPLLQKALSVRGRFPLAIPEAAQDRLRNRVMAEWDRRQQPRSPWLRLPSLAPRWAAVAAMVVLVVALSGVSTVAAAGGAVPGDLLYPVKEFREEAQLWFALSSEAKVEMYTKMVQGAGRGGQGAGGPGGRQVQGHFSGTRPVDPASGGLGRRGGGQDAA